MAFFDGNISCIFRWHFLTLFIYVYSQIMHGYSKRSPMEILYKDLMAKYEKDIRPSKRYDQPLNITFAFALAQIVDVDEKNQIITTYTWINQNWIDNSLQWDPLLYNNITTFHIPKSRIWLPDTVLYNNADPQYKKSIFSTDVFVKSDGNVTWLFAGMFKSSCEMNVRYYPFDEQVCVLKFASWTYDGSMINLLGNKNRDDSNYVTSTEWELTCLTIKEASTNFSCCPDENFPYINVTICIKRNSLFYVFNLILPCILITGMSLLGFHMPANSGEKVTLGTTTLLSITVSLMLMAENMPPTYETLPLIGTYYITTLLIVSLANIFTMLTLNIHHKGELGDQMPKFLKLLTFKYLAPLLFVKPQMSYFVKDDKIWERQRNKTKSDAIKQEWQQLSVVADRVFIIIFTIVTVFAILIIMYEKELNIV